MSDAKTKGLSSNVLKAIAMTAMTIDHFTAVIFPAYPKSIAIILLHTIGRLAAPIFWFFIAEGYFHTRSFKKYFKRILIFAVISHFAYNFAFGIPFTPFKTSVFNQTSIYLGFAMALLVLRLQDMDTPILKPWIKTIITTICYLAAFPADWSTPGTLVIVSNSNNRGNFKKQMTKMLLYIAVYAFVYFLFVDKVYGLLQMTVALSIPLLNRYNGERGKMKGMMWIFYVYYPLHLILCGIIRILLHGNVGVMIGA
ncbi:MAG: TraX family protein [Lachnospiraceae bacterium]